MRSAPRKCPSSATAYHRRVVDGAAAADDSDRRSVAGRYLASASARQPTSANTHNPTVTAPSAHNRSPRNLQLEPEDTPAPTNEGQSRGPFSQRSRLPLPDIGGRPGAVGGEYPREHECRCEVRPQQRRASRHKRDRGRWRALPCLHRQQVLTSESKHRPSEACTSAGNVP